ncbi:MAG: hypothetical protein DRZ90_17110 [Spirochaetes bacterium]|nr:MAG: hypothetical protein DRZ90_17110 [Spirochaetota bacterium]
MEIRERIIRVEEFLDKHITLTKQGFDNMDKRFEQVDKRFSQMFAILITGMLILGVLITTFGVFRQPQAGLWRLPHTFTVFIRLM